MRYPGNFLFISGRALLLVNRYTMKDLDMTYFGKFLTAAALAVSMAGSALAADTMVGDLTISNPAIRATPPKAPVSGGYMLIKNAGSQADRLVGGSVDFAGKTEVHEMKIVDEVMKMREVKGGLEIPAGGEVLLKPGGYHVMFMKLKEQLKEGETRKVKLMFEKAGEVELDFDVKVMMKKKMKMKHDHSG